MPNSYPVAHCNLLSGVTAHRQEILDAVTKVIDRGWYILGEEVENFEKEFSDFHGYANGSIGVANGTDALCIALRACGLSPGDGVVTVSHTAVATVAAIEQGGFVPILADIEPCHHTMCPESTLDCLKIAKDHGVKPRALLPVHLYGHPANLSDIMQIAKDNNLLLIEDCSQAHGAMYEGKAVGTFGDAAAWSLYPTKNLAALGDAGVVFSRDEDIQHKAKLLRQYGWKSRNMSLIPGVNSRLDEIQAAILRVRLRYLNATTASRQRIAETYDRGLKHLGICPTVAENAKHVWHQYVITPSNRDAMQKVLANHSISTMIHYPTPIHQQPAYANRTLTARKMTNTLRSAATVLSLPMYPELNDSDVSRVVSSILTSAI
jgi:dTDP-4-amino-4,6-dideoxygalactose transaminase